jgi:hypothetical protein
MQEQGNALNITIADDEFGPQGHTLSEYVQLIWLFRNFEQIVGEADYVRLFQYRKFIASRRIGKPSNLAYARWLRPNDIAHCSAEFSRHSSGELVSSPLDLPRRHSMTMATQYARAHNFEDLLAFTEFLRSAEILTDKSAAEFMAQSDLIPSASLGVFRRQTLKLILESLTKASSFVESNAFVTRNGEQRRNMGFLLERLHSFLIFQHILETGVNIAIGQIAVINESPIIAPSH